MHRLAEPGSAEYLTLAATLALLVGALQLAMGLLRAGVVVHFLSHAVVVGVVAAFPVTGGFSRSAVHAQAGARSGLASVVTALLVLVTLAFLTPLFHDLPQAVLGAIVVLAVAVAGFKGPVRDVLDRAHWRPERRAQVAWPSIDHALAAWGLPHPGAGAADPGATAPGGDTAPPGTADRTQRTA